MHLAPKSMRKTARQFRAHPRRLLHLARAMSSPFGTCSKLSVRNFIFITYNLCF